MKNILLDVDEVICFPSFLQAVNEFMGTDYVIDDFRDYYIEESVIPEHKMAEFNAFVSNKNLYDDAIILPRAIEVIENLSQVYDIYICSSCVNPFDKANSGRLFMDKYNFLTEKLPFIDPGHFIFTSSKNLFLADIQIDDRLSNLNPNIEKRILFPSYHNRDIDDEELDRCGVVRAGYDWRDGWSNIQRILIDSKYYKDERSNCLVKK